jgi:hypothetical protein
MRLRPLALPFVVVLSIAWSPLGLGAASAQAQTHTQSPAPIRPSEPKLPELETDRPDITEASTVVMPGVWQLETGLLFQSDRVDPITAHDVSAPNVLLRLGVAPRLELRVGAEGVIAESLSTPGTGMTSGISDLELAIKYKLFDQEHAGLDIAVIPLLSLPMGSDAFTSGGYDPTVKLTWSRDLARGFGLGGNVIVSSITDDGARFTQTAVSASLGHGLGEGWGGFWELYGASALSRDGNSAWLFDTGVTRALGTNAQIDVSVGRGLTEDAPDWFIGVGFSIRGLFKH